MASRTFLDTNVLVYLFDADAPGKQARARPLPATEAEAALRRLIELPVIQVDPDMILAAAVSGRRDRISFWDALILAAASAAGCGEVLSEDLQHGRSFGRVRVVNPFRE